MLQAPQNPLFDVSVTADHVEELKSHTISVTEAIPADYKPFYEPEVYSTSSNINQFGRPRYTERKLVDWLVNDIRSVLFVHELAPSWNDSLPAIKDEGWQLVLLPLRSCDTDCIDTLANSALYREQDLEYELKRGIATAVVAKIRRKNGAGPLSLPNWRAMIELYLLILGCEAQFLADFHEKLEKVQIERLMCIPQTSIMRARFRHEMKQRRGSPPMGFLEATLFQEGEKNALRTNTRHNVYVNQGLNWPPEWESFVHW